LFESDLFSGPVVQPVLIAEKIAAKKNQIKIIFSLLKIAPKKENKFLFDMNIIAGTNYFLTPIAHL